MGYFHFLLYLTIILVIVSVIYLRYRQRGQNVRNSKQVLKTLKKCKFSAIQKQFKDKGQDISEEEQTCIICWVAYNQTDEVIKLKCNDKHFYHAECIESWIKAPNNSCPMCRKPIDSTVP
jgi:hypothetical protein